MSIYDVILDGTAVADLGSEGAAWGSGNLVYMASNCTLIQLQIVLEDFIGMFTVPC